MLKVDLIKIADQAHGDLISLYFDAKDENAVPWEQGKGGDMFTTAVVQEICDSWEADEDDQDQLFMAADRIQTLIDELVGIHTALTNEGLKRHSVGIIENGTPNEKADADRQREAADARTLPRRNGE